MADKDIIWNETLKSFEDCDYIVSEHTYRRNYPFPFEGLAIAEGYVKGRIKIVLCFEQVARDGDVGTTVVSDTHFLEVHCNAPGLGINEFGFFEVEFSRRWQDALMLVSDIKLAEFEKLVLSSRVWLHLGADKVSDRLGRPITGSYLSVDGTLYGGPILPSEGEKSSVCGSMPVGFDHDTVSVIKGSHEIVHGVTERSREMLRGLNVLNGPSRFQRSLLILGEKSLLVVRDEAPQEGFYLSDVLVGPFYLEVGTREVDIVPHETANG